MFEENRHPPCVKVSWLFPFITSKYFDEELIRRTTTPVNRWEEYGNLLIDGSDNSHMLVQKPPEQPFNGSILLGMQLR